MRRGFSARAGRRVAPGFPTVSAHRPEFDCASLFPASGVPTYHPHHGLHRHHNLPLQAPAEAVGKAPRVCRRSSPRSQSPHLMIAGDGEATTAARVFMTVPGPRSRPMTTASATTVIARRPRARSDSDMTRRNTPARRCGPRTGKMHRRIGTAHSLYEKPKDST